MAYQRPFLISLKRGDPQQPWGFRTFGGREYGQPITVEKVLEDSIAEHCGLHVGDEVIQVGRINVQQMSFGQVQELLARFGNKIEMFVIREDFHAGRKGKEPPTVKAVVHNPYNSPLSLYSTENIAETLAKQTEVLTEGRISPTEEEEGPENLSFKQKSAVFKLLEEQASQDIPQSPTRAAPYKKAPAPPPPQSISPSSPTIYQNKENYSPLSTVTYTTTQKQAHQQTYQTAPATPPPKPIPPSSPSIYQNKENYSPLSTVTYATSQKQAQQSYQTTYTPSDHSNSQQVYQNSVNNFEVNQPKRSVTFQTSQHNQQQNYQTSANQKEVHKTVSASPPTPTRAIPQRSQNGMASSVYSQYQQQPHPEYYNQQRTTTQHYQDSHHDRNYQSNQQWSPQSPQQQPMAYHHQEQNPQQRKQEPQFREAIYEDVPEPVGTPIMYKAPPTQKHRVHWPPAAPVQQNGRWSSPSPTPTSPTRNIEGIWPPRQPTVRELPKTGFNPAVIREQGSGRRCVWPPPRSDSDSGRTTPQSPVTGRRINWNPSPSPPTTRRTPFNFADPSSPVTRRKDIAWPPPQPQITTYNNDSQQRSGGPHCARRARFDDYVRQHAGNNVPCTYRPPPGTQRVEYC